MSSISREHQEDQKLAEKRDTPPAKVQGKKRYREIVITWDLRFIPHTTRTGLSPQPDATTAYPSSVPRYPATVPGYFVLAPKHTGGWSRRGHVLPSAPKWSSRPQIISNSDLEPALLRISGEIREQIYGYVFSEQLRYIQRRTAQLNRDSTKAKKSRHGNKKEYNQLKYVCRQLYYECYALELKHGELIFSCNDTASATEQFLESLEFSPMHGSWIRNVKLIQSRGRAEFLEPIDRLLALGRFCRNNPHAVVRYIFEDMKCPTPHRNFSYTKFLPKLFTLKMALRHEDCYRRLRKGARFWVHTCRDLARGWRDNKSVKELTVPNLIFLPRNGLKEEDLKYFYEIVERKGSHAFWHNCCNVEILLPILKDLLKNGI